MWSFGRKSKQNSKLTENVEVVPQYRMRLGSSALTADSKIRNASGNIVVRAHTGKVLFRYWIHVLAITAAAGLATLNFLNVDLMPADDPNAIAKLGAFQFVAKLHEGIMLGSLSLALIDYIRRGLVSEGGIPLGYVLSPVMYNNIDWLLSASFWTNRPTNRQVLSHCMKRTSALPPFMVITLAILFANVAGPMSAITIVPRLGWSTTQTAGLFPTFWNMSASAFRPDELAAASLSDKCTRGGAMGTNGCPAWGSKSVAVLWSPVTGPGVFCDVEGFQASCNATMSNSASASIVRALSVDFDRNTLNAYASTPNAAIYSSLAFRFQSGVAFATKIPDTASIEAGKTALVQVNSPGGTGSFFKPAVATSCRELQYDQIVELYESNNITTNWTTPTVTWLADAAGLDADSFLFSYRLDSDGLDSAIECNDKNCYAALVCSIAARWSSHDLWYNTAQSSLLFHNNPQPRDIFEPTKAADVPVLIRKDWLQLTSVTGDTLLADNIVTLLNQWRVPRIRGAQNVQGRQQANFGPTNHSSAIGVILAATITESMANGPANLGDSIYTGNCSNAKPDFRFSDAICAEDPSTLVHVKDLPDSVSSDYTMANFSFRTLGWGWFWQDSLALQISLGALLLHGLLTLFYLIYKIMFTRTLTTRWASATELLILAIDSFRAPRLADSSIQARDSKIWFEPVTIREVEYGDRVSLIVGDGQAYPERVGGPPELGKKYL